jgi:spermidine synthase
VLVANVFTYDPRHGDVLAALGTAFENRLCWLDGVAGNNRIVYALDVADPSAPAPRRLRALARRHGSGRGWVNRALVRLLLARIAWRSVLSLPHRRVTASTE